MTNATTAPVQSLVDEILDDLDRTEKTHLDGEVRDIARDAVRLIRQQQALIAQQAATVAVPDEHLQTAHELLACFDSWEADVRVLGNVRAADAASFIRAMLASTPTPPAQQPRNRHGIDAPYFHNKLGLLLRDFDSLTPDELARSLARLAKVADESVLLETEFAAPPAQQSQWVHELSDAYRVPDDFRNQAGGYRAGWNDCRAAMLAAPGDTAPPTPEQAAGTTSDQYRAELYDEVWQKARDMGYGNVTEALVELERAKAQTEQPVRWGSAGTVGNLIAQLRTIDPGMPVYASLRIKNGVRDGVMLKGLVISYEHGDGRFIVKDGPERCVVIWTQPDDRQAEQDAEWVEKAMEQAQVFASAWSLVGGQFDTGDGLEHAKEEKQRLRALLEGGR